MNNKRQRNRLFTMLLLVMAILMPYGGAWAQTTKRPAKGNGDVENPFQISTAAELAWFRDYVNEKDDNRKASAKLIADIDLSGFCHAADASKNIGNKSWEPIGNSKRQYEGTFDGNGKTITNLYINASQNNMGLFGYTYKCTIKNLTFEFANVTNRTTFTGILVGWAISGSTFQNIKISETCQIIGDRYTGGIAGELQGNASNCVNYAKVQEEGGNGYVGGLFGSYSRTGNSITACANYGNVTATGKNAGGLVGYFVSGTIQDCANYGNVKGTERVAGIAGFVARGNIKNVFSYGSISDTYGTQEIGMAFGSSDSGTTEGMVAYYSGAKLTANGQEITIKAFGKSKLSEDNATGFTEAQLKSGFVAYQLQQNASSEAKWGQNLANDGDIYPVIGSEYQVYADNLTLNCKTYKVVEGSLTNNPTSSAFRYQHVTTSHHVATDATCTEAATKEYWQCQDCQRIFSDSQLTKELTDVTDAKHPALGHNYNEDGYCDRCKHYVAVKPSEENGVYLIAKPCHLAWFRDYVNGTIVNEGEVDGTTHLSASAMLTADIDLTNYCHAAEDGKELLSWIPICPGNDPWQGNMDGQGHTISNLYIKTAQNYVGLFGYTVNATIQDLIFDNAKVENVSEGTGILVGIAYGYSPSQSHIKGIKNTKNCTVIGQGKTGGIVGFAHIPLENCENHSSVKGTNMVGGIAGYSANSNIKRCTNYGTVENNNDYIGGIIGWGYTASIEDCANYGKITSTGHKAGGIAGVIRINSSIQNVFSYGDMTYTGDDSGIIIGYAEYVDETRTAKGIVAYNKEVLLNNSSENIPIVGGGKLLFEDGKVEADVVKAFTKQQIESGEVAYLLAEGKVLGEQAWGQQLGKDQYPVPGSDNKVIKAAQGDKDANGNDTYWATFSNPTNDVTLSVPSDRTLKVYNATVRGGKMTLTQRSDYQVAKEEGVLLKTNGEYVNAKANETNDLTKVSSDVNHLVATPAEAQTVTAETGCKLYRLTYNKAEKKEGLGFYLGVDDGKSLKATPGKAYLKVSEDEAKDPSSAALARSFVFGGGNETTGIEGITIMGTDVQRHGTIEGIFDLQGRKISNPTKGIYIKNNKKVVIK